MACVRVWCDIGYGGVKEYIQEYFSEEGLDDDAPVGA